MPCLLQDIQPRRELPPNKLLTPAPHFHCKQPFCRRLRCGILRCPRYRAAQLHLEGPDHLSAQPTPLDPADPDHLSVPSVQQVQQLLFRPAVPLRPAVLVGLNRRQGGGSKARQSKVGPSSIPPSALLSLHHRRFSWPVNSMLDAPPIPDYDRVPVRSVTTSRPS